jgi:flagellar biosynthesis protein
VTPAPASADRAPPRRRAAALSYGAREIDGGRAPRLVARGEALVAEQIIERARAAGVPVHESHELVALLMQLDLDRHIPPALYVAVAEVLAWVYRLQLDPNAAPPASDAAATAADATTTLSAVKPHP